MKKYEILLASDIDRDMFFAEINSEYGCIGDVHEEGDELIIEIAMNGRNCRKEPLENFKDALYRAKERLFRGCSKEELLKTPQRKRYSVIIIGNSAVTESLKAKILDDQQQLVAGIILEDGHWMLEMYSSETDYMSTITFNYPGFMEALEQAKQKLFSLT